MNTVVVEECGKQVKMPFAVVSDEKKQRFEDACAKCNAVPLDTFINELKASVKEYFDHA